MHELSISSAIVDTALRHAGGQRVTQVDVRVGALRQVVPESLAFYFEIVARDTACDGATLELEIVDGWMACGVCGSEWDPAAIPIFRCPACESADATIVRGQELEVESIEVETSKEEQCIAPR
jgi:hydrogenase nickel incorporation protein HypA/HybF